MSGSVRNRFPEHVVPGALRNRYLATGLTRRRLVRQSSSIIAAVVVAAWIAVTVDGARTARASWGESSPVVMMTRPVGTGESLTAEDLRVEHVPNALIPEDAVMARTGGASRVHAVVPPETIGRRATTHLGVGRMLTEHDLDGSPEDPNGTALAPGEAAVTIESVPRLPRLRPGDSVDVYGSPQGPSGAHPIGDAASSGHTDPARTGRGTMTLLVAEARIREMDEEILTLVVPNGAVVAVLTAAETGHLALVVPG